MATCFDNIISFKGKCDDTTPTSGLWLDQIGLHKTEIEQYLQEPYSNADQFFDDIKSYAITYIKNKVYSNFTNRYKATSIVNEGRIGHVLDNMTSYAATLNTMRGVNLELCNHVSPLEIFISEVSLFIDVTATVTVQVWDLNQNKQLDTFTISTTANQISTAYPALRYTSNREKLNIALIYDVTLYDQYAYSLSGGGCASCRPNSGYTTLNNWVRARAVEYTTAEDKTMANATGINHTGGMSLVYSVNCNHQDWLCAHSRLLAPAILNKTAAMILDYGLKSSQRQTSRNLAVPELIQKRIDAYEFAYRETMDMILKNILPPNDPVCYDCNNRIKSVMTLP